MSFGRGSRVGFALVMLALLVLQFYLRPRIWDSRIAPDFLVIALLIIAMGSRPGTGAIAGLIIGLVSDALTPARVGAGMLAYTIVGYVASWGRAVFFAENILVHAGMFFAGVLLRNIIVVAASGSSGGSILYELLAVAPLQGLTTAVAGMLILYVVREWFAIRLDV
ncbi:MAG TPA: rod shape-determining protein MreD [Gemmatimonadales bacterium]|nr:rod shape-determining protein MreD [Gemmatimonadales bacterium]